MLTLPSVASSAPLHPTARAQRVDGFDLWQMSENLIEDINLWREALDIHQKDEL